MMKYWLKHLVSCDAKLIPGPARLLTFHELGRALDDPDGAGLYCVVVSAQRNKKRIGKIVPGLFAVSFDGGWQIQLQVKEKLLAFDNPEGSERCLIDMSRLQPEHFEKGVCYLLLDGGKFAVEMGDDGEYWLTGISLPDDVQNDSPLGEIIEKIPGAVAGGVTDYGDPFAVYKRFLDDPIKHLAVAEVAKGHLDALYESADQSKRAKHWRKVHPERVRDYVEKTRAENAGRLPHGWKKAAMRRFGMTLKTLNRYLEQIGLS